MKLQPAASTSVFPLRVLVAIVIAGVLGAGSVLSWYFMFRDTWEADNAFRIRQLADAAAASAEANRPEEARQHLEGLKLLVGERRLEDTELRRLHAEGMATLEEATLRDRLASEAEQKSIANRTAAAKATQLMVEAQALEAQGAWKDAIARYRDAVSAIDASTPDFPEAPAIRATLQAALSEVQARHANAEREAIAAREAQDEAERIAKLRVTMSGGAWLVTQAGRSEPIRGLHIVVAIRPVANSRTSDLWKAVAAESEGRVAEGIASLEEAKKQRDQMMEQLKGSSGSYVTRVTEDTAKLIGLLEQSLELKSNQLADAKERMEDALRAESTEWIMLDELFAQLPRDLRNAELEEWLQLLAGCTVGSTHTNVEGKYELTLAGGHFVAFASSDSLISTVKWAIPIEVKSAGPVKVDFWNDTAAWIHNKKP